jgi:hypothetical protein
MRPHLVLRFDYSSATLWVTEFDDGGGISATVGSNLVVLRTKVALEGRDEATFAHSPLARFDAGKALDQAESST